MSGDPRAELRVKCETTVEGILRDAAELGWSLAQAGVPLAEARAAAVTVAPETAIRLVAEIMRAGALVGAP